jgi:hypothetical protein
MEEFSSNKLRELLSDMTNMDQNCLMIPLFSRDTVDELWEAFEREESDDFARMRFFQMLLIAFGAEGSYAARIRSSEVHYPLPCWPKTDTLILNKQFRTVPYGVVSQLVEALSIRRLVIEDAGALPAVFDMDFNLMASQIVSVEFKDLESDYQLNSTLYSSPYLEELSFIWVKGSVLTRDFSRLSGLRKLKIVHCLVLNGISLLPLSLEYLKISHARFGSFEFSTLPKNIRVLDFSHNNLKEVIGADSLALLHDLDLSNNQLGTLDLGSLPTSLKALNLRSNRIERIVGNFDGRENLRFLDLGHNALTEFPSGLELLTGLNELLLSNNFLEEISGAIGNLTLLERLDLRKNRLRSLPNSLSNLNRLLYLDLEDNLLTEVFRLLSKADWDDATVRLRGNPLHQERRKLYTLNHQRIEL